VETPCAFHYNMPREFLNAVLHQRRLKNPRYSLRAWSKQLGFQTPSYLSEVLRGVRKIKPHLGVKIANQMGLAEGEKRHFELTVLIENARSTEEKDLYLGILHGLKPTADVTEVSLDQFRLIQDWYHFAILEMVDLKDFNADPGVIAERLGRGLTAPLVEAAFHRLLRLGLLIRDDKGRCRRSNRDILVGAKIPSRAIRDHHKQLLEYAAEALEEQSIDERYFSGTNLAVESEKIPQLFKLIDQFHQEVRKLASTEADTVYRVNMHAFKLTKENQS
jgi:uncharacterized protein (TIGR02147 family)